MSESTLQGDEPGVPYCERHDIWHLSTCEEWEVAGTAEAVETSEVLRYVELVQERARVREEEQRRLDRACAALILGQGVILGVPGVGLTWPDATPTTAIEEAKQLARKILGEPSREKQRL